MKKRFIVRLEEFKEPLKSKIVISKDGIELEQGDLSDEEFEQEKKIFADFIMSQAEKYPVDTEKHAKIVKMAKNPHADYHISPIDKLSQAMLGCNPNFSLEEFFDAEPTIVATGKKITVSAILRYENMPEALLKKIPNRKTRAVHDTMTSLICEGNRAIRLQDIAYVLSGYRSDRKAT